MKIGSLFFHSSQYGLKKWYYCQLDRILSEDDFGIKSKYHSFNCQLVSANDGFFEMATLKRCTLKVHHCPIMGWSTFYTINIQFEQWVSVSQFMLTNLFHLVPTIKYDHLHLRLPLVLTKALSNHLKLVIQWTL